MMKSLFTIGLATLLSSMITGCDVDSRGLDVDTTKATAQVRLSGERTRTETITFPRSDARGPIVYAMELTSGESGSSSYLKLTLEDCLVSSFSVSATSKGQKVDTFSVTVKSGYDLDTLKALASPKSTYVVAARLTGLRRVTAHHDTAETVNTTIFGGVRVVDLRQNRDGSVTLTMSAESVRR